MPASKKDKAKIQKILERVDRKEQVFLKRTEIMDSEYEWGWKNIPFKPLPTEGIAQKDAVTTNGPHIQARKVSNGVAFAERIIRVEDDADNQEFRDQNNAYERLCIGMLENADRRLQGGGMGATVQGELAWYSVVRGAWVSARALLIKDDKGNTIEDVKPIDPRNLVYEQGQGEPLWAAIVTQRSKQDIRDSYPKFKFDSEDPVRDIDDDNDENVRVVDYYWKERGKYMNAVIIDNQFAKKAMDTFAENFPIVIRLVGNNPGVMNFTLKDDIEGVRDIPGLEDVGNSIFAAYRHTKPQIDRLSSYEMALTAKAVQGTMKVFSRDGTKELDQDPFASGTEANLSTDNNEDIELVPIAQLSQDTARLRAQLQLDEANAGLSDPALGRLGSPVSGAALNIISQADNEVIAPFLKAVESVLEGVLDNLGSQYETGKYKTIHVRGKTHTDIPFNKPITPEDIKGHNVLSVELKNVQPQDDFNLWQTAQIASQVDPNSGMALVSKEYAATKIAKVQDYDLEKTRMFAAQARQSSPAALWLTQLEAAHRTGDPNIVEFVEQELNRALEQQFMEDEARRFAFMQAMGQDPLQAAADGMGGAPAGSTAGVDVSNAATVGADPRVFPQAGTQGVSAAPSPDAGFNTTAPRKRISNVYHSNHRRRW
jgi:hypothetical protein